MNSHDLKCAIDIVDAASGSLLRKDQIDRRQFVHGIRLSLQIRYTALLRSEDLMGIHIKRPRPAYVQDAITRIELSE